MRMILSNALVVGALALGLAACGEKDLDEAVEDVLEEQQEAVNRAARTPGDTAAIRREAEDVVEAQKDVQEAMKKELKDKNIPATTTNL